MKEHNKKAIYIPIWLDLLLSKKRLPTMLGVNLHSNMVRFIILIYSLIDT